MARKSSHFLSGFKHISKSRLQNGASQKESADQGFSKLPVQGNKLGEQKHNPDDLTNADKRRERAAAREKTDEDRAAEFELAD